MGAPLSGHNTASILLICNVPERIEKFRAMVAPLGVDVLVADGAEVAVDLRRGHSIAMVLFNVSSSSLDGKEVIKHICRDEDARYLPIICIADEFYDQEHVVACYEAGAVDLLRTPLNPIILQAKVRLYFDLHSRRLELEEASEIIHAQNEMLQERASRDGLTGLYNHISFHELFNRQFSLAQRQKSDLCLLIFDLDYFKEVNDTYGHQVGDRVLEGFAKLVAAEVRESDVLARYGGEEFALVLPDTDILGARLVAEKIRERAEQQVYIHKKNTINVTVSVGGCQLCDHMKHPSELIDFADDALYQAKAMGRNRTVCVQGEVGRDCGTVERGEDGYRPIRERLKSTIDKTRSRALASFEAMVHGQTKDYFALRKRNKLALKMVNLMGQRLHLPNEVLQAFRRAFKLHDLLRIFIADSALGKSGSLTEEEMTIIRDQPLMLKELTSLFDFFADERALLLSHHECFDGSGYPEGLRGGEIPMGARLFALVDAFVAMSMPSYQRPEKTKSAVIAELTKMAGSQFDPFLVEMMIVVVEESIEFN